LQLEGKTFEVNATQMLVTGEKDRAIKQGGFGENKRVMQLFFRQKSKLPEPQGNSLSGDELRPAWTWGP